MMTLARLSNFTGNIPHYFFQGLQTIKQASLKTANWAKAQFTHLFSSAKESEVFKPLYTRYIERLDVKDGVIFAGFAIAACLTMFIFITILGPAFLAMGIIFAFSLICVSVLISKKRLENKTGHEVAEIYENIITLLREATFNDPFTEEIEKERAKIFDIQNTRISEHLKEEIDNHLRPHLDRYLNDLANDNDTKFKDVSGAFLTYVEEAQLRLRDKSKLPPGLARHEPDVNIEDV